MGGWLIKHHADYDVFEGVSRIGSDVIQPNFNYLGQFGGSEGRRAKQPGLPWGSCFIELCVQACPECLQRDILLYCIVGTY